MTAKFPIINTPHTPRTWWGVEDGEHHNGYNILMNRGRYPFGCGGDSRHKGLDVRPKNTGSHRTGFWADGKRYRVWSWGYCILRWNAYNNGGYHRYIQVYFPEVDASLTIGHVMNGSTYPVGTVFQTGDRWCDVGTLRDGLGARHIHYRAAWGDWHSPIGPCNDIHPGRVWNALKANQERN